MTPYLFLDVDGVLNAGKRRLEGGWTDWRRIKIRDVPRGDVASGVLDDFVLRLSKTMCAALATLPVEIHWATTWEHLANERLYWHTGLNDYPVACRRRLREGHGWKWEDIRLMLEADPRPVIWLDDECIPEEAGDWCEANGIPYLFIAPDEEVGLTRAHVDQIKEWLDAYPQASQ